MAKKDEKAYGTPDGDLPVMVALSAIDNTVYKNSRSKTPNADLEVFCNEVKLNGLLNPPTGMRQPSGSVGISSGFRRFEVSQRLALEKVFDEYNKSVGLTSHTQPGYRHISGRTTANGGLHPDGTPTKDWWCSTLDMQKGRQTFKELGPDWAAKYDAALSAYQIPVSLFKYKSPVDAFRHNAGENGNQVKISLLDEIELFKDLSAAEMKQKDIAAHLGKQESMMSHLKRVANLSPYLRELFTEYEGDSVEGKSEEEGVKIREATAKLKERALAAVDELDVRMALDEDDPRVILFRHVKDMSYAVNKKDKEENPDPKVVYRILHYLTRMNASGQPTNEPTPDSATFEAKMKEFIKEAQAADAAPAPETPAAGTPSQAVATTGDASPTVQTPEDLALMQAAQAASAPASAPAQAAPTPTAQSAASPPAAASTPTATPAATPTAATPTSTAKPAAQATTEAANAALSAAGSEELDLDALVNGELGDGSDEPTDEELKALDEDAAKAPKVETRTKTMDAPVSKYRPLSPDKLEAQAASYVQNLNREGVTLFDQCASMLAAQSYYYAAGMDNQSNDLASVHLEYEEACDTYLAALEELIQFAPTDRQAAIRASRPKLILPSSLGGEPTPAAA